MPELSRRVLAREVNAKIREIQAGLVEGGDAYELLCECCRDGCEERVAVPDELNGELAGGLRFIVAPGHEEREPVVEARPTYLVVSPA